MPPKKRGYYTGKRKLAKKYGKSVPKMNASASVIQGAIRRALQRNIETKSACVTASDYTQIGHNSFVSPDSGTLLATTQGVADPNNTNVLCRIGDQINLQNISIRMMFELNERYSDVTYRILVVKASKGDTVDANTLFVGLSGNKMLDRLNRERFTILYEKWGKIRAPNNSVGMDRGEQGTSSGVYYAGTSAPMSRATKIVKIYLSGKLFSKTGIIQYENASSQVKMYDYHLLVYAYSNYATSSALGYNVLAINDYVKEMYYKDA